MRPFTHLFIQKNTDKFLLCARPSARSWAGNRIPLSPQGPEPCGKHVGRFAYLSVPLLVILDCKSGRTQSHTGSFLPLLSLHVRVQRILPKWPSADAHQPPARAPTPHTHRAPAGGHRQKCWAFCIKLGVPASPEAASPPLAAMTLRLRSLL